MESARAAEAPSIAAIMVMIEKIFARFMISPPKDASNSAELKASTGLPDRAEEDLDFALQVLGLLVEVAREAEHAVGHPAGFGGCVGHVVVRGLVFACSGCGVLLVVCNFERCL